MATKYLALTGLTLVVLSRVGTGSMQTPRQAAYEADVPPSEAQPPWTLKQGKATETVKEGMWVIEAPVDFFRGIDLGELPQTYGQRNVVELRWATTGKDDLGGADGLRIYAGTRLLRMQPLSYRNREVLLTGTSGGMSLSTPGSVVDLSSLPHFRASDLNVYRIEWATDAAQTFPFDLSINGTRVGPLQGETVRDTRRIGFGFELASGTHTIDYVRWDLAQGGRRVIPTLGEEPQLLFDDRLVDQSDGLVRTIHQPDMHPSNPLLEPEKPWEYSAILLWGSVIYDEDERLFKMWYQTWGSTKNGLAIPGQDTPICYAVSKDGLRWERPGLHLYSFRYPDPNNPKGPPLEASENNIVYMSPGPEGLDSPTVVKDSSETDPEKRYKMSWWHGVGIHQAHSADGIHWREFPDVVVRAGDRNTLFFNPVRNRWTVITRGDASFFELAAFGQPEGASLAYTLQADPRDLMSCGDCRMYSFVAFPYGNILIGLPELYSLAADHWWTELAWSYDGETWHRDAQRTPFLDGSRVPGSFDFWRRHPSSGPPIRRGDKLWFYLSGRMTGKSSNDPRGIVAAVGVGVLRVDGFCSRDAGEAPASLTTQAFRFDGRRLLLNADVRPRGSIKAALLDEDGKPLEGFSLEDAMPVTGDHVAHVAEWRAGTSIGQLAGKPVRLHLRMQRTSLYSFRFARQ